MTKWPTRRACACPSWVATKFGPAMLITAKLFDTTGLATPPEAVQCPCESPSGEIELGTHALVRKGVLHEWWLRDILEAARPLRKGVLLAYCEALS